MNRIWNENEAEAYFEELLEACLNQGTQVISRDGKWTTMLAPLEEWRKLRRASGPTLKDLLLAASPRTEKLTP